MYNYSVWIQEAVFIRSSKAYYTSARIAAQPSMYFLKGLRWTHGSYFKNKVIM